MTLPEQGEELRTIRSGPELAALAEEWNALALRCPGYCLSQTHQWAETSWETVSRPQGHELHGVTLWSDGRLIGVWPLAIYRDRGAKAIRPLGFEGAGYCAPLVEPGEAAERHVGLLWRAASRAADVVVLRQVRSDSLLAGVLKTRGRWRIVDGIEPSPYVACADYPDWAAYHATLPAKLRTENRRRRRRLEEKGTLVCAAESPAGCAALIDWMLVHKQQWLVRSNLANDWIRSRECRDFLTAMAMRADETGGMTVMALKLDGVPIAANIVSVDRSRVAGCVTAFDFRWHRYAPGSLLSEELTRWAFAHGLDFDFRNGEQSYKLAWARRSCDVVHCQVASTPRGAVRILRRHAGRIVSRLRRTLRQERRQQPVGAAEKPVSADE